MDAETKSKINNYDRLPIVGAQPKSESEKKFLKEICEYEFYNLEESGLSLKFPYGNASDNTTFVFFHGGKYKVPRHVARHLESKATPRYAWRPDGSGSLAKSRVGDTPRFQMRQVHG